MPPTAVSFSNDIVKLFGSFTDYVIVLMITSWRSIIAFAWTFFVGDWVTSKGAAEPFGIFAMLMGLFGLTVIPVWLYGKRLRIATASWVKKERFD